jgi:hypothetical protein
VFLLFYVFYGCYIIKLLCSAGFYCHSLAELLRLDLFGAAVAKKPTYGRFGNTPE